MWKGRENGETRKASLVKSFGRVEAGVHSVGMMYARPENGVVPVDWTDA